MPPQLATFAGFVSLPENRSAYLAARDVAADLGVGRAPRRRNPLYLHGPAGVGKSHLIAAVLAEAVQQRPQLLAAHFQAQELQHGSDDDTTTSAEPPWVERARDSDVLIVEDLQHVPARALVPLMGLMDRCTARRLPMLFTANVGPQQLGQQQPRHAGRLASRLACGVVARLAPLGPESRRLLLARLAEDARLPLADDVLCWLAEHLAGGRQLLGALTQLQQLALQDAPLPLPVVMQHFQTQAEAGRATVERIAERVCSYFRIESRHLRSRRRYRSVLVPRQVSMYLARRLTNLSLQQIGAYFGGRDHSTVLHACHKIEAALDQDAALGGAVKELQADLG